MNSVSIIELWKFNVIPFIYDMLCMYEEISSNIEYWKIHKAFVVPMPAPFPTHNANMT